MILLITSSCATNSALQINNNYRTHYLKNQHDTRKGVVLVACVFLFTGLFLSSSFPDIDEKQYHLQVSAQGTLHLASALKDERVDRSRSSLSFSPFFFEPVPINFAKSSLLTGIDGIGMALAERIISTREKEGFFLNPDDLLKVHGIGKVRQEKFTEQFSFTQVAGQF